MISGGAAAVLIIIEYSYPRMAMLNFYILKKVMITFDKNWFLIAICFTWKRSFGPKLSLVAWFSLSLALQRIYLNSSSLKVVRIANKFPESVSSLSCWGGLFWKITNHSKKFNRWRLWARKKQMFKFAGHHNILDFFHKGRTVFILDYRSMLYVFFD